MLLARTFLALLRGATAGVRVDGPRWLMGIACILTAATAAAQTARWDPAGGRLPVGQSTALRLVFENCTPDAEPAPPKVDGLTLQLYGTATNTELVNSRLTVMQVYTFAAALSRNQPLTIPAFTVATDKGAITVPAATFEPGAATVGRSNTPLSSAANARLTPTPASVYAGEVFELAATVSAGPSFFPQFTRGFEWTPDPLIVEAWSDPQQTSFTVGAEQQTGFTYRSRAVARNPGRFNLNAATHIVNLSVGVSGFGFFQQRQYDQYTITSNTPTLEVKPLPPAPAGFTGATGEFKLVSKVVPERAAIGEPITWTLELSGTGNWPDIPGLPAREVSNDFQVVQPKAKRTAAEGKIFDLTLTEDVVLVPGKAGTYSLGPVSFVYFDPKTGAYQTARTPRTAVTITGPSIPQIQAPSTSSAASPQPAGAEPATGTRSPRIAPVTPAAPGGIPRDPLPGSDTSWSPWSGSRLAVGITLPFLGAVAWWLWLALREAKDSDPVRARREARARLALVLSELRTGGSGAQQVERLQRWQRDAAVLWELAHAAPPPAALPDAAWADLWREADRAIYGASPTLPADWAGRAEAALAAKQVPRFHPLRLFLPRNLFPFAAAAAFAAIAILDGRAADDPLAAYRGGDFASAEKSWRAAIAAEPTDWIARHNLSLALAQQERTGEAAGQAAAAFVQNPGDAAVRWHFALAVEKAGFAPPALAGFLQPDATHALARMASPATWQRWLVAAAVLGALAVGIYLTNAYRERSRRIRAACIALFGLAWVIALLSTIGMKKFGMAGRLDAVVVAHAGTLRSVPTEADATQKTTPLAAGSLARVDKSFLEGRWIRLSFANGQTGWVRKEDVVPLWR